jgi:hypothetical protein
VAYDASHSGGANAPRQTELSTNNTVLVTKVQFGPDENIQFGDTRLSKKCSQLIAKYFFIHSQRHRPRC